MNKHNLLILPLVCLASSLFCQTFVHQRLTPAEIKVEHLDSKVNSTAPDFAPVRYGDRVYFSSSRQQPGDEAPVSRIYSFTEGKKATLVDELNTTRKSQQIGNVALMPDASRMYFTICKGETQEKCDIWYRERTFEGGWSAAKRLPDYINESGSTTTQPAIGWDKTQKKFVLYFVSNRAGGRGGLDVWCSAITWDGQFETPYSLPSNSAGDDVTPFFDATSQTLYFSTNGLGGAGGFDIFVAEKKDDMWNKPFSMGRPFNSSYDDLYFSFHETSSMAYFTSDRPGSVCDGRSSKGAGCYDLYRADLSVPVLRIRPFNPDEGMPSASNNMKGTR